MTKTPPDDPPRPSDPRPLPSDPLPRPIGRHGRGKRAATQSPGSDGPTPPNAPTNSHSRAPTKPHFRAPTATGPALTASFLRLDLPDVLTRLGLPPTDPARLATLWRTVQRHLAQLGPTAGAARVLRHAIAPLALGPHPPLRATPVTTREGPEDGGHLLRGPPGTILRAWAIDAETDLDAPIRSAKAWRASPLRAAHRVLRAGKERMGLLTNGQELRLLISDPALPDSHLSFPLDAWRAPDNPTRPPPEEPIGPPPEAQPGPPPEGLDLLLRLASEPGVAALPRVLDAARLHQARVTDGLRSQARAALEGFLQAVIQQAPAPPDAPPPDAPPPDAIWHDGLVLIHRLLFILKLEASSDPAQGFSFAATRLWRESLSPNQALGPLVRRHLDHGQATGTMLETGLRQLFRAAREGLRCAELVIAPLGGALFAADTMPVLDRLPWGERAVALLLDRLLWTSPAGGARERVHYGALDVEVLGGVYESLLDLEPGIAGRPMTRLRRGAREVVTTANPTHPLAVEAIPAGRFFLRAGQGRKASGSYYTPTGFVRFLVAESLGPACRSRSPGDDPDPGAILALRVLDPATGSGHFLVEACRFLAEALFDACRRCDALARDPATPPARAAVLAARIAALPDPDGLLASWLPALAKGGIAERRAMALCRRLVAVHCLYGADRNPLAIELAKLALWLESHAEGLPLTFLDHRLVQGDSLAGPFLDDMQRLPVGGGMLDPLLAAGLAERLAAMHATAVEQVRRIGATLGRDLADLARKQAAREALEAARAPLVNLARAWAGAAVLATREGDDEWQALAQAVAATGAWPAAPTPRQAAMLEAGAEALPWDLAFAEVAGFDAVIGNPPWDVIQHNMSDFVAGHDLSVLDAPTRRERAAIEARVLSDPAIAADFAAYRAAFDRRKRVANRLFRHQRVGMGRDSTAGNLDAFRLFAERSIRLAAADGAVGLLLPSAFHANEGTTGIRRLFLDHGLETCLSFENRLGLFDIDSRFKFALVVARRPGPARAVRCAFYLEDIGQGEDPARLMTYDRGFIDASGGPYQTLMELRGPADLALARRLFATGGQRFGAWCASNGIRLGRDLHMTDDAGLFSPVDGVADDPAWCTLHEGKTFHHYTDRWDTRPRYRVRTEALAAKPLVAEAVRHFRLAFRDIARSNDERSAIATIMPPGVVLGHTATVEKTPGARPPRLALALCAVFNAFPFDWLVRQKTATHLSLYLLDGLPMPSLTEATLTALADTTAALCANDARFAPLVGDRADWPAMPDPAERQRLRAAADALVARAYGLTREEYAHVLASFSHASWRDAPGACLAAYDRIAESGSDRTRP